MVSGCQAASAIYFMERDQKSGVLVVVFLPQQLFIEKVWAIACLQNLFFMDARVIIFYWFGYLFCAFVNNYVVTQLLYHRGHMHFHGKRKFHEGFSLDTIIKELLQCQTGKKRKKKKERKGKERKKKKKSGSGVITGFLQCLELNEFDSFSANLRVNSQTLKLNAQLLPIFHT